MVGSKYNCLICFCSLEGDGVQDWEIFITFETDETFIVDIQLKTCQSLIMSNSFFCSGIWVGVQIEFQLKIVQILLKGFSQNTFF